MERILKEKNKKVGKEITLCDHSKYIPKLKVASKLSNTDVLCVT